MKIYLDNCCLNRPFDDQSQLRIKLEAEAKLRIQEEIRDGGIKLVWSYILDYENSRNPYVERKEQINIWKKYSVINIIENDDIIKKAVFLNSKGFKKFDSLHIACAIVSSCDYILTTDDNILKKLDILEGIKVNDPIGFIKECLS